MQASLLETHLRSRIAVIILAMVHIAVAVNHHNLYTSSTTLTSNSGYDYIVIGGGTSGSVVATKLAEKFKYTVLVIEAGGDPPHETIVTSDGLIKINKLQLCSSAFTFNSKICKYWSDNSKDSEILVTLLSNIDTKSRGQITLASVHPEDQPKIVPGVFSKDEDLDAMVDYVLDYLKVEETDFFKKINAERIDATNCNAFKLGSREYWRCYILCQMTSLGHYGGTCAMGTVVDGHLRVKGVHRLRIGDASVMPSSVNGNTQQPVILIAEKLSQCLIDEWEIELPHHHHHRHHHFH